MTTKISGIPCSVDVHYRAGSGQRYAKHYPSYTLPDDGEFWVTCVYDRKGYRADWLAKKLTSDEETRIMREYIEWRDEI